VLLSDFSIEPDTGGKAVYTARRKNELIRPEPLDAFTQMSPVQRFVIQRFGTLVYRRAFGYCEADSSFEGLPCLYLSLSAGSVGSYITQPGGRPVLPTGQGSFAESITST
jgi:hypothetical protein